MLLQLHLQLAGYQVVAAAGCGEALHCAEGTHFDLCILDHCLEDGTGTDLRQELREIHPNMPVLYHTAMAYSSEQIKTLRQVGDDYLLKPVESAELKEAVAALLNANL